METSGQKLKNKIICWSIMCKTSAVTLLNKLTNHSWCLTCLDYNYNGSLDIVVDILSTEFSVSNNGMDFFSQQIYMAHQYFNCKLFNFPDWSPAYFNNYVAAVHYLPCFSLLISVLINMISAKCPFLGQTDSWLF